MDRPMLEVKNLRIRYASAPTDAVRNVSFTLGRERLGIVGESGSGKSTIISLIERFYDPTKGKVMIDGKDVRQYHLRTLRKHIALVSQEPTLFEGSIRENILYSNDVATLEEIVKAAKAANAHDFIR